MNEMAWSLENEERELKDWKVGIPAGYTVVHPVSTPESPFAGVGSRAILENLRGFRALFQGCGAAGAGLGFDDWLSAAGSPDLAHDMVVALDHALEVAEAFPPMAEADATELDALYVAIKGLTNLLKSDFFGPQSVLSLNLPAGVEGDTD
jgi:uncharacterized protein